MNLSLYEVIYSQLTAEIHQLLFKLSARSAFYSDITHVFSFNYCVGNRENEVETSQFVRVFVNQKRQTVKRGVCVRVSIVGNEFAPRSGVAHCSAVH